MRSPALRERVRVRLLTPAGWRRGGRWPVLYLLHAAFEPHTYRTWTLESDIEAWPQLHDLLVVMPEGGTAGFYSGWWNHGAGGPPAWETFHLAELRPLLEERYGAGGRRAIAGVSMGGFGALSYAARHPGTFRAAAGFSGPVHLLHPEFVGVSRVGGGGRTVRRGPLPMWGDPVAQRRVWAAHDPYHLAARSRDTAVFL